MAHNVTKFKYPADVKIKAYELYMTTMMHKDDIARQCGIPRTTLDTWAYKEKWLRDHHELILSGKDRVKQRFEHLQDKVIDVTENFIESTAILTKRIQKVAKDDNATAQQAKILLDLSKAQAVFATLTKPFIDDARAETKSLNIKVGKIIQLGTKPLEERPGHNSKIINVPTTKANPF